MSKKKTGKMKDGTWVERALFMSPAFLALTGFAPQLLILFLGKRDIRKKDYKCLNADSLTMTYAEMEKIHTAKSRPSELRFLKTKEAGIARPRFIRALDELLAKGFIRIVKKGGKAQHDKTIYGLSNDWCLWSKGTVFATRKKETRTTGYINKKTKVANETVPPHAHVIVPLNHPKRAARGNVSVPMKKDVSPCVMRV